MSLPVQYDFNGLLDRLLTAQSANWTFDKGSFWVMNDGTCRPYTSSQDNFSHWNADTFPDNQYAQSLWVDITGNWTSIGIFVRWDPGNLNGYSFSCMIGDGVYYVDVHKWVNGVSTSLGNSVYDCRGMVGRLEASGTTLTPLFDGSGTGTPGPQTDNAYSSGPAGIMGYGAGNSHFDNWEAGEVSAGGLTLVASQVDTHIHLSWS